MRLFKVLAILATALTATSAHGAIDPAPVVAAERAFAADGKALGVRASFLKHSTSDAIVFAGGVQNAHALYGESPPDKDGPALAWWPLWAGISRSGDLGFTTGPASADGKAFGYYFTVWSRQADGGWKWIYDGGPASDPAGAAPQGSPVSYLPLATAEAGSADLADRQVAALETALNTGPDLTKAYLAVLAADGRLVGSRNPPQNTPEGQARELARRPPDLALKALGVRSSRAGDLAWTWGEAAWSRDGEPRQGHYVRIWQDRAEGWKLVYDALLANPPKPAA